MRSEKREMVTIKGRKGDEGQLRASIPGEVARSAQESEKRYQGSTLHTLQSSPWHRGETWVQTLPLPFSPDRKLITKMGYNDASIKKKYLGH